MGRTYREVFREAAEAGAEALIRRVLETGEPWQVEDYRAPVPGKPDATWQGQVVRLPATVRRGPAALTIIWDITERKQAEAAVRESEARLRATLRSAADEIWIVDTQGRIVSLSDSVMENLGVSSDKWADVEAALDQLEILRPDGTPRPREDAPLLAPCVVRSSGTRER